MSTFSRPLLLAGRPFPDFLDAARRYCGLPWSGGAAETWAFPFFDAVATTLFDVEPADVTAASVLHPGMTRDDLHFFSEHRADLEGWLADLDPKASLADASQATIEYLERLTSFDAPSFTLLAKVMHRKRPGLIPLLDRHIIDLYRPITGERQATLAWPRLLIALRADLLANHELLTDAMARLAMEMPTPPTSLRIVDIAVWMRSHP